jgi:hypothetical protein
VGGVCVRVRSARAVGTASRAGVAGRCRAGLRIDRGQLPRGCAARRGLDVQPGADAVPPRFGSAAAPGAPSARDRRGPGTREHIPSLTPPHGPPP